jgi:hypothetical protein
LTFYKKQLLGPSPELFWAGSVGTATAGATLLPGTSYANNGIVLLPVIGTGTNILLPPSIGSGRFQMTYSLFTSDATDTLAITSSNNVTTSQVWFTGTAGTTSIGTVMVFDVTGPNAFIQLGLKHVANGAFRFNITEVSPTYRAVP